MPADTPPHLLFVYGTLMRRLNWDVGAMLQRIAEYQSDATLPGRLYDLGPYPMVLDPLPQAGIAPGTPSDSPTSNTAVHGELWRLRPGENFNALDAYEQCGPPFPEPWEFVRVVRSVAPQAGKPIQAWVYGYGWPLPQTARLLADGRYRPK